MKSIILVIITGALTTTGLSVQGQAKSATEVEKQIREADIDQAHREAEIDSAAVFEVFRKNVESQILKNRMELAALKKKYTSNKGSNELRTKRIIELEKRNKELGTRVNDYITTNGVTWSSFKGKLVRDMKQLADEIKVIS